MPPTVPRQFISLHVMIRPTTPYLVTLLAATHARSAAAFHVLSPRVTSPGRSTAIPPAVVLRGFLGFGDDEPKEGVTPIPPELRDDIYEAEAKAPAAQGRQSRIVGYAVLTFLGVTVGFFNAFLTVRKNLVFSQTNNEFRRVNSVDSLGASIQPRGSQHGVKLLWLRLDRE